MPDDETVLYRGQHYDIGHGPGYYGIWPAGAPRPPLIEWWPDTPDGWNGAWSRFTGLEAAGPPAPAGPAILAVSRRRAVLAASLLAAGVACGIAGLFPDYFSGASLAAEPAQLVPHVVYLAAWTASALLILAGGARPRYLRAGALLGLGTSIVTFGFFLADAGTVIAGGAHLMGAGLALGLAGWLACAAGSAAAIRVRPSRAWLHSAWRDQPGVLALGCAVAAALGTAIAFVPSWDSYTLRTPEGVVHTLTAGNAFANPAPVVAGNVAVMAALVLVAAVAALWRPVRLGAVLLAGAIIPMAAQAVSALVQAGEAVSPAQFGISPAQAAQAGLTISSGLTPVFWVYCAFVVALAVTCGWLLFAPRPLTRPRPVFPPQPAAAR